MLTIAKFVFLVTPSLTGQIPSSQAKPPQQGSRQPLFLWRTHFLTAWCSCFFSCMKADIVNIIERLALCLSMLALLPEEALHSRSVRVRALAREAKWAAKHLAEQEEPQPLPEPGFFKACGSSDFLRHQEGAPWGAPGVNLAKQGLPLHAQIDNPPRSEGAQLPWAVSGRREAGSPSILDWQSLGSPEPASVFRGVARRSGQLSSGEKEPMGKAGPSLSPGSPSKNTTGNVQASRVHRKRLTVPQKRTARVGVARRMAPRREVEEVCPLKSWSLWSVGSESSQVASLSAGPSRQMWCWPVEFLGFSRQCQGRSVRSQTQQWV
jgi:hypothetical protein